MADILILEIDDILGQRMLTLLTESGHQCHLCRDITQAQPLAEKADKLCVIMDARLPWTQSHPFLHQAALKGWPVLFTTEDGKNQAHLEALYAGISQVLVRPFKPHVFLKKVESLLSVSNHHLTYGSLQLDQKYRQVFLDGQPLSLTAQEFALLEALMLSPDTALSREQLLRTAWGYQGIGETRTVDVHVQRLRKKLGVDRIETVYKLGYRLRLA